MERRPVVDARGANRRKLRTCSGALSGKNSTVIGPGRGLEHRAICRELRRRFSGERLRFRRRRVADDDAANLDPIARHALVIGGRLGDLLDDVEAFGDAAEDRVLALRAPADR